MQSSTYTDLISRQAKFEFHGSRIESEMENHANVVCYENVTFVRPISSHATIKTEKNADFLSYISPHAKIIAKETPTFHSEICDHVSIECPGQPNFKPGITIGHHVKVNGKIIPPTGQPQSISVIGVNGDFSGGYVSVSGNSLLSSTSAMASLLNNHDSNVGNVSLPSRDNLNSYSDEMKDYIASFKDKTKNSDILKEMQLTDKEKGQFPESYYDPITHEIFNIPILLHDKTYDLQTLLLFPDHNGIRFNTDTLKEFTLADVMPDYFVEDYIPAIIERIRVRRIADAQRKQTIDDEEHKPNRCIIS